MNSKLAALQKRLHDAEMKWFQADKKRIEAEKRAAGLEEKGGLASEEGLSVTDVAALEGPVVSTDAPPSSDQQKALIDDSNA